MKYPLLLALGWLWPFLIAAAEVAAVAAGQRPWGDDVAMLMFFAAFLGSPAVVLSLAERMPAGWHPLVQSWVAVLLAVPIMAAELFLAVCLFALGANAAGPGWIE